MKENLPSKTARQVAARRAAHQFLDAPKVFDDPLAARILGLESASFMEAEPRALEQTPLARFTRAFVAARSRFVEDALAEAVPGGVCQYVVLGAGLDTFAYRSPYGADRLCVFEVDYPSTQAWKRELLERAAIPIPSGLTFAPVDFETQTLDDRLQKAGFDASKQTLFSWLGVIMYLTSPAITTTLSFIASMPAGSGVIFDYIPLPSALKDSERRAFDTLASRVSSAGEPFRAFFDPGTLQSELKALGFSQTEDLGGRELNDRYFHGRTDGLRVGNVARLMHAVV